MMKVHNKDDISTILTRLSSTTRIYPVPSEPVIASIPIHIENQDFQSIRSD